MLENLFKEMNQSLSQELTHSGEFSKVGLTSHTYVKPTKNFNLEIEHHKEREMIFGRIVKWLEVTREVKLEVVFKIYENGEFEYYVEQSEIELLSFDKCYAFSNENHWSDFIDEVTKMITDISNENLTENKEALKFGFFALYLS